MPFLLGDRIHAWFCCPGTQPICRIVQGSRKYDAMTSKIEVFQSSGQRWQMSGSLVANPHSYLWQTHSSITMWFLWGPDGSLPPNILPLLGFSTQCSQWPESTGWGWHDRGNLIVTPDLDFSTKWKIGKFSRRNRGAVNTSDQRLSTTEKSN